MSDLNEDSILLLSQLCRIELKPEEITVLLGDLKRILDYVSQLQEVDVKDLSPHSHLEEQSLSSLRDDHVGQHLSRDIFLSNAPDHVGGMIRVPPVMKPQ